MVKALHTEYDTNPSRRYVTTVKIDAPNIKVLNLRKQSLLDIEQHMADIKNITTILLFFPAQSSSM